MLNKENLIIILDKLFDQSKKYYDDFNSADAKIGDGDLGITILHGLEEIQKNKVSLSNDMGENFMVCSKAFVKRSGSSFGTLIAFSLMNISKKMQGKTHCDHNDIISFFETALETILERGKSEALENFKGKKILIGRARMFEEKTKEFDDPGMFAFSKLCEVF